VVGVVESASAGGRFARGDRVGIAWLRRTCGRCAYCTSGRENLCERAEFTGWHADGGFAEFAVVPAAFAYAIPAVFGDVEAAPLLCAGIIGFRALERAAVPPGGRLGLWGFGSSAHVILQISRARGARVYVLTREASHRKLATALGAAWTGDLGDTPPEPLDSAIVFAPVGDLVPIALRRLARGGTLALAGIYMTPTPPLDYARDLFYERQVRSVTANTRADGEALLAEAAAIGVRLATTTFALTDANRALSALKHGAFAGSGVLVS
jgi:propanol-preferring alcohol dehydrogenase